MSGVRLSDFNGKDVVFVGVGQGRSMANMESFLRARADIRSFTGVDKQPGADPLGFLRTAYDIDSTIFIKNEAIPVPEMPVAYVTGIQLFFEDVRKTGAVVIGVTGTKGKSTTSSLIAHILQTAGKQVRLAGNIGLSTLSVIEDAHPDMFFVLELSSYQLADMAVSPHISVCTNLYNDHADWHGSVEAYQEAKHNIMRFATSNDVFIYNDTFAVLRSWASDAACRCIAIDAKDHFTLQNARLFGEHNRLNALMAREVARLCNVPDNVTTTAINDFEPLTHRMQLVSGASSHVFIDDAIGMTPESTMASIRAVTERYGPVGCLLLGGQDRVYDFKELFAFLQQANIMHLVLFPDTIDVMKAAMPADYQPAIYETADMLAAVRHAIHVAPHDSIIMLSTAAPSYSLWRDFNAKGEAFVEAIRSSS